MTLAPALAQEQRAPPGPPTSLLPAAPAVAVPPARPEPAMQAPAPAPAPARDVVLPERAAASRHPVSPVLYLPPGPGRPGLTARVAEPPW